jgi:formate hydrogenlyase transcriptional activator
MADALTHYQALARLCRAAGSSRDLRSLIQEAAEALHELTGCDRVSLLVAAGPHGLAVEFDGKPRCEEIAAESVRASAAQGVFEQRQPRTILHNDPAGAPPEEERLFEHGYRACVYQPLVCGAEVVGVLGLASRATTPPWDLPLLEDASRLLALAVDDLAAHERVAELQRLQREVSYLRDEIRTDRDLRSLTGESQAMKAVRLAIQQVACTDSTVLILGETGTGKELVARAIHQLSARRQRLLVTVNCAALAPGVLASELFGHEQGAFTGAIRRRVGRFELAHRGTIFLDEVGELPAEMQVMLLRVLQERVIERVGGQGPIPVDVRVIAATHQELPSLMGQGRFRADLYFRLNVFPIRVPPLRDRREDVPDLVRHFVQHFARRMNKPVGRVSPATLKLLSEYRWPGNVRELENLVERAMIVSAGETLKVDPNWLRPTPAASPAAADPPRFAQMERQAILDALERSGGRIYGPGGAAAALGLKPTTLYGKMRKHGIARRTAPK